MALGGLLLHDGEVGTDEDRLAHVEEGDPVTVKGELQRFQVPDVREWRHIEPIFANTTYMLETEEGPMLLITGMPEDLDGVVAKIDATVAFDGPHPTADMDLLVLQAYAYTTPFLFR